MGLLLAAACAALAIGFAIAAISFQTHTLVISMEGGTVIAATDVVPPGESSTLEVALDEGTYQFTCRIVSQDSEGGIVDHFEEGMVAEVSVGS